MLLRGWLGQQFHVGIDHDFDQLAETDLRLPAENSLRLPRVTNQQVNFRRTLIAGVMFHVLLPVEPDPAESDVEKFAAEPEALRRLSYAVASRLRVMPLLGRAFLPEDDQWHGHRVAVVSHELWRRRFAANPDIKTLLAGVLSKLTTANIVGLNAQVDIDHKDAAVVAKDFLTSNGLL